jgi:O-antigen ligase
MVAVFIALVWLVPVDQISLTVSLPFDLHFDRIVLPFILLAWGLAIARGGALAPRVRLTPIHLAIGAYLLLAFLSVVVNAGSLNQNLALNDSIKGLLLLTSYGAFFLVAASVIRPSEVDAFLKYSVGLAVVCAIGLLVEYRLQYNAFYTLSGNIFPSSIFHIVMKPVGGFDELGRVNIIGPANVGLEVAAMLSMALPATLVGLMYAARRRTQLLYGLFACIILAAGMATYKKSAIVAPAIDFVVLGLFFRWRLLRLVPVLVILVGAVHVLAPGAIGSVTQQFTGGRLTAVGTTVHRLDGYDAIRPIVWSHPLLGEGIGGYNALENRILDNEILDEAITMGVLGVMAYVAMSVSVAWTALRLVVGARDSKYGPAAIAGACAGICFLTVSFLYDSMSYPHTPYIFLSFAALVAVVARSPQFQVPKTPTTSWSPT